jgi:hypothetical protein
MSPFHGSRESRKACNHCGHPFSRYAPSPAACTRSGCPDRSRCTACTSAAQIRTSGTALRPNSLHPAAPSHTARSVKRLVSRANLRASDPARGPNEEDHSCALGEPSSAVPHDVVLDRCPDIQVDGISPNETSPQALAVLSTRDGRRGKCTRNPRKVATDLNGFSRIRKRRSSGVWFGVDPWHTR